MKGQLRMADPMVSLHLPLQLRPRLSCQSIGWHARDRLLLLLLLVLLGAAAHDLDLVGIDHLAAVVKLERDVTDQEGPDFIAEAVGIERPLDAEAESVLFVSFVCTEPIQTQPLGRNADARPERPSRRVVITLNVNRALTFSCRVSAMTRSNWVRTFMASCGSMRSWPISSSRASVKATPRLWGIMSAKVSPRLAHARRTRRTGKSGRSTFHADTNRNSYLKGLPCCLVLSPLIPGGFAATEL